MSENQSRNVSLSLTREYPSEHQMCRIPVLVGSVDVAKNKLVKTRVTRNVCVD